MQESAKAYLSSPVGPIEIVAGEQGITSINFMGKKKVAKAQPANPHLKKAVKELEEYFSGKRQSFDLELCMEGTPFQKTVWKKLLQIPFGEVWSYGELAKKINKPKAARAVGGALNKNPIGIVVPCHRVVGSNGDLTGFAGGMGCKRWLLDHEKGEV